MLHSFWVDHAGLCRKQRPLHLLEQSLAPSSPVPPPATTAPIPPPRRTLIHPRPRQRHLPGHQRPRTMTAPTIYPDEIDLPQISPRYIAPLLTEPEPAEMRDNQDSRSVLNLWTPLPFPPMLIFSVALVSIRNERKKKKENYLNSLPLICSPMSRAPFSKVFFIIFAVLFFFILLLPFFETHSLWDEV